MLDPKKNATTCGANEEPKKTESFETSSLNPITNKKYADEIIKSMKMLLSYEDSLLRKFIKFG